jgi:hypothetical protein
MFPRRKEEALRNLAQGLSLLITHSLAGPRGAIGVGAGVRGCGSRLPINDLIEPPRAHGSRWRAAMAAMQTCGDFRNEKRVGFFNQQSLRSHGTALQRKNWEGARENIVFV